MNHKPLPHRLFKTGTLLLCYSNTLLCVNTGHNGGVQVIPPLRELKPPLCCLQGQSEVADEPDHLSLRFIRLKEQLQNCRNYTSLSREDSTENFSFLIALFHKMCKSQQSWKTTECSVLPPVVITRNYSVLFLCWSAVTYRGCLGWLRQRFHWCSGCRWGTLMRPGGSSSPEPGVAPVQQHPAGSPSAERGVAPAASDRQSRDQMNDKELQFCQPSNHNLFIGWGIGSMQEARKSRCRSRKKKNQTFWF